MDTTCGIHTDSSLWCWGVNSHGEIGDGSAIQRSTPVHVGASTWKSVSAGSAHTCAVRSDNALWCWGINADGELGVGVTGDQLVPVQVGTQTKWSAVDAGVNMTQALLNG